MANFTYILADEDNSEAAVIDPSWDLEKIFAAVKNNGLKVKYIINTHTHFDHILGNHEVAAVSGAKIQQVSIDWRYSIYWELRQSRPPGK